ncbi:MAG: alpha/beta fold hydrolase, partial [Hyphomicrobiales bacterium]|nr:alpha/beta fold hydrolase [Hyphomicrobiales bacterium]
MAFIAVSGVAIHCRDEGPRDAPVVLFANSLGSDLRIWDDVAGRLAATRRVVRYDKRGHGLSDAPPGPYSLADQTRDALGLLDALGVDRFAMVGVSVGGLIAQAVALEAAARLTSLVLVDSGAKIGTAEGWDARIAAVRDRGLASISRGIVAGWLTPAF